MSACGRGQKSKDSFMAMPTISAHQLGSELLWHFDDEYAHTMMTILQTSADNLSTLCDIIKHRAML